MRMITKSIISIQPAKLPPTVDTAKFHSFRVFYQISQWNTSMKTSRVATDWGWKRQNDHFEPIY